MKLSIVNSDNTTLLLENGKTVLTIPGVAGCTDSFETISENAWRWTRVSKTPVDQMKMVVKACDNLEFWQVPSVNYNGNGWGSGAQYSGFSFQGEPWTYAWHRVAVPACTYAESKKWAIGLFGNESGGMSGSIWSEDNKSCQALIWPEQEGPKVLFKRCWMEPYKGSMEPQTTFTAVLFVAKSIIPRSRIHDLLDFAWSYFYRDVVMEKSPEEIIRLDTLWFRQLWHEKFDGLIGFSSGMNWDEASSAFLKSRNRFEIGWVGQNASLACTLLREYQKTKDTDLREKALSVLDSWVEHALLDNGLMLVHLQADPKHLDSMHNGDIPLVLDACNLGTAATYFFKAAMLTEQCNIRRPEYRRVAMNLCDFAVRAQTPSGEFAKSWFIDGSIDSPHGTVGAFLILPLFDAYQLTGNENYRQVALKAFEFYYNEFISGWFTTAGALDSFCIDKESAAPLIRAALQCYHATKDQKYIVAAEEVGYYLATWQWHYSTSFPEDSIARKIGYDTYGGTSVSAAHNAQDPYGLYYVPEYLELATLTGKEVWKQRARALWYNGIQLLSDGTLVINNRVRPAGSQDESVRHTRWGRTDMRIFVSSEWLVSWSGSFRQVALDMIEDWEILR